MALSTSCARQRCLDVRMVSNTLVVDDLHNVQIGTSCTLRCRSGGQGRAELVSGDAGAWLCRVGRAGKRLSGLGEPREGQLSRRADRLPPVHRRSSRSRLFGSLRLLLAALAPRGSWCERISAGLRLVPRLCRSRRALRRCCCPASAVEFDGRFFVNSRVPDGVRPSC